MPDVPSTVRAHLREEHADVLAGVEWCADAVVAGWDDQPAAPDDRPATAPEGHPATAPDDRPATTDRDAVVGPLRAALQRAGLLDRFPVVLTDSVRAAGFSLPASPVPAPPYVVVTSRGPVLRATVDAGRLVVTFEVFTVERGETVRYVRTTDDPLDVRFRR